MIKSNRCNKSLIFFFLSYLEMCSKTNFPTSLKKFYMYRYMLTSLRKMTYVEVNIHFSQIRCCFIQSFDYVTHYMTIKKYLTPQRWIWIGIDHTWWLTAFFYQTMVYWSVLILGWSVIICTNYKSTFQNMKGKIPNELWEVDEQWLLWGFWYMSSIGWRELVFVVMIYSTYFWFSKNRWHKWFVCMHVFVKIKKIKTTGLYIKDQLICKCP